jgi:hypothetical protein
MARFYGEIGFGDIVETAPGITEDVITGHKFHGDVLRSNFRTSTSDKINTDTSLSNSISIVGTKYAFNNIRRMRYIKFEGVYWTIDTIEVARPRLIIGMGDVYNGPKATAPSVA